MAIPAKTLAAGKPVKIVQGLSETEMKWKAEGTKTYQEPLLGVRPPRISAPL